MDGLRANYNSLTSKEEADRVMAVMNGDIPIVYVNGRVKANATPEEVEAEYRRSDLSCGTTQSTFAWRDCR